MKYMSRFSFKKKKEIYKGRKEKSNAKQKERNKVITIPEPRIKIPSLAPSKNGTM